jgi:membrane-bound lytic murein transglycosylase D
VTEKEVEMTRATTVEIKSCFRRMPHMVVTFFWVTFIFLFVAFNCSVAAPQLGPDGTTQAQNDNSLNDAIDDALSDLKKIDIDEEAKRAAPKESDAFIESELKRLLKAFGENTKDIPEVFVQEVRRYVNIFQENDRYRKFLTNSLQRKQRYSSMIKTILKEKNIPPSLEYLALVESGFNNRATSRAGAVGVWQFMPGTARDYSLVVSKNIDERTDPEKSTFAAAEHFKQLLCVFGDWLIAMAAYNAGERRVTLCLKEIKNPIEDRSFWQIRGCLAPETRQYPPLIVAAAVIGENPERFGFSSSSGPDESPYIITASPRKPPHPEEPVVRKETTVTTVTAVPEKVKIKQTPATKIIIETKAQKKRNPVIYFVQQRNKLTQVADLFDVDADDIVKWNSLKRSAITKGQKLKIYTPVPYERTVYTVKKDDTISEIAQSFKIRPSAIVTSTGLKNGWNIITNQKLVFYRVKTGYITRTVRKGEKLSTIARSYHVNAADIIRWNNLTSSAIKPKQVLKIFTHTD